MNVVLIEPEIPPNTGAIGRLCLATGARLHLVEPLGFDVSEKALRRAGLDYWEHLDWIRHASVEAFLASLPSNAHVAFFTKKAGRVYYECEFHEDHYLVFGKETLGLPDWILNRFAGDCWRLPIQDARVRSINLAQAVAAAVFEAIRQTRIKDLE